MPAPIRILAIGHEASRSGATLIHLGWLKWAAQQPNRFEVRSITIRRGPLLAEWPREIPHQVLSCMCPGKNFFSRWMHLRIVDRPALLRRRLQRVVSRLDPTWPDIVVVNTLTLGWLFQPLTRLRAPVVIHAHELGESVRQFTVPADIARMKEMANCWIAVSRSVHNYLIQALGVDAARVQVVRNFPPPRPNASVMPLTKSGLAAAHGLPAGVPWIVAVGNISPVKRPDLFIQVAEFVRRVASCECAFIWVGERSGTPYGRKLDRANANGAVHFVGGSTDPRSWIKAATLLLITSAEESSSLVALEAAQIGTPIAAVGGAGGTDEFLAAGAGWVIPTTDLETIANVIERLLREPQLAKPLVVAARAKVAAESEYGSQCEALASILEKVESANTTDG